MTGSEIFSALLFYIVFSLLATIGLPLTAKCISNKILAYAAAKPAGLVLFGYFIWLLSSLRVLDYQKHWLILIFFCAAILAGAVLSWRFFKDILLLYKKLLFVEGIALLIYFAYLFLRSYNPAINGTEKFMDMSLLTAAGKTNFFPFLDAWYAGKTVNYYYYGSYLISLVSNLAHIPYSLSYNLALGLLYSQSAILSAMLVFAITKLKSIAIAAAFLVTTAGTWFFAGCTLGATFAHTSVCNYASSTRLYTPSYIINEIPSYSFTVGDLHAHLLALPIFLFNLILLYALSLEKKPQLILLLLLALSMTTSGMINAWDLFTLVSLLGIIVLAKIFYGLTSVKLWLFNIAVTLLAIPILMWPSLKDFHSPVVGLRFIWPYVAKYGLENVQYPTPALALAGIWGIFIIGAAWAVIAKRKQLQEHLFAIALSIVSLGIIIGVELFFVADIYSIANPSYFRANTTFKFGYHAWIMLSIAFILWMVSLIDKKRGFRDSLAKIFIFIAIAGGLFYPYEAINQFYLSNKGQKSLDGSLWMKKFSPEDWEVIQYVNKNFNSRAVIAEAVGDSYTTYSRITTYSGMIAPMGWKTHEWTWRFQGKDAEHAYPGQQVETGWSAIAQIATDIQRLYETADATEATDIIKKYGIQYVYIGALERTAYPNLQEQKFYEISKPVFQTGASVLFEIKK